MSATEKKLSETAATAAEFVPADYAQPLAWPELFQRVAPVEVDLGCGDGSFLAARAMGHPERDFLGIERLLGRVRSTCKKAAFRGLTNLRVIRVEIGTAVEYLLPPNSVDAFHLLFPDPWPKRRHQRRRVVTTQLLNGLARALKPGGVLHLATDQRDYFEQMLRLTRETGLFVSGPEEGSPLPVTTFEKRFRAAGDDIYRVMLRTISDDRCADASQRSR